MLRRSKLFRSPHLLHATTSTTTSPHMKDTVSKITFRDVLLAVESKGRTGARTFQGMPGLTRELAALEIVNQYGANRVTSYHSEPREFQLSRITQNEVENDNLLLTSAVHSVFGRLRSPVSFLLDIDAKHETEEESKDWKKFEDRVLGVILFACRNVFARNTLQPRKICILTAGDGTKRFASLHLHVDFTDTAFVDMTSIANFIRGELIMDILKLCDKHGRGSAISNFAKRVVEAIDAQPFAAVGGSLRVYGAPKLDGSRPCRLYRPLPGSATAIALNALRPTEGGPTIDLMKQEQQQKRELEQMSSTSTGKINKSSTNGKLKLKQVHIDENTMTRNEIDSIISKFDPTGNNNSNEILMGKDRIPVIRKIELDALAMSLGTPDWMSPIPFRFISFNRPRVESVTAVAARMFGGSSSSSSKSSSSSFSLTSSQQQNEDSLSNNNNNNDGTTTDDKQNKQLDPEAARRQRYAESSATVRSVRISTEGFPIHVLKDIAKTKLEAFPVPETRRPHSDTYLLLAARVTPLICGSLAKPYRSWISVCLALTDILVFTVKSGGNQPDAETLLLDAFLQFAKQAPNYDEDACVKLFKSSVRRKMLSRNNPITIQNAIDSYRNLVKKAKTKSDL